MTEHRFLQKKRGDDGRHRDVRNVVSRPGTDMKKFTDKSYSQTYTRTNFEKGSRRWNPRHGRPYDDYNI